MYICSRTVGTLVAIKCSMSRLGGAAVVNFACSGCGVTIDYTSSGMCDKLQRHTVVSIALRLAAFLSGIGFRGYNRLLKRYLGIQAVMNKNFSHVIEMAYIPIKGILDDMCEQAKAEMKSLPTTELGSWERAVTTSDGCWHIRGFFSQNSTFIIRNYLTGALLFYGHASMRGCDSIISDDLYQGTAKSAEGYLAGVLFQQAKEEGCKIAVNWQDQDSSSEKSFHSVFGPQTSARVMKCGGHVGRAHGHALKDIKAKKEFTVDFKRKHRECFPQVDVVACCCKGKRHSPGCGCITDGFIEAAKRNLFCAIVQCGNDSSIFADRLRNLGKYHVRGIHSWDGGKCDFHPLLLCSCGECNEEVTCEGKAYESKNVLRCELHSLAYEIECNQRASQAAEIIDPELGQGHSNLCESTFSVVAMFRLKDTNLHRVHYQAATNLGLMQSNMTYLYSRRGSTYHWVLDLYRRMGLPELQGIQEFVSNFATSTSIIIYLYVKHVFSSKNFHHCSPCSVRKTTK